MPNEGGVSQEFLSAVRWASEQAAQSDDEAVRFIIHYVPVYAQARPTREQAIAGGCVRCTYLGLWTSSWPGYPDAIHGTIWVFEEGIRAQGGDLYQQTLATLKHEIDHALERDHVLEHLKQAKAAAMVRPQFGCCR